MARAATSPELAYYRSPGIWSQYYVAFLKPPIVYRARINQTFSTYDQVLTVVFDGGSGDLANVLPDMEVWIGSTLDAKDKGICRLRDKDATHFYLSETSEIAFVDNDYVTIVAAFGLWARPVRILSDETVYMDEVTYSDQHTNFDPMPNMGTHRVLELTGSSVNTVFDGSTSFCPGSSIAAWLWQCSTASASSGTTTNTATFTFNTTGWHVVYLTITAANLKTFFGVRYVYVWNEDNPPPMVEISDPARCNVEMGGWNVGLTLHDDADIEDIYERAMIIVFAKDYYDDEQVNIGPVSGSENIRFIGWVSEEASTLDAEDSTVTFKAQGAAHWMSLIPSWPDGVELTNGTASAWTNIQGLTVDKGVYHHLRWRSTITRICDVTLTSDTRLTQEVSSSAQNLWLQLQEMTWNQIYARPGVNYLNQFSVQIHPNLIPTGSRAYPTVMDITIQDRENVIELNRIVTPPVGLVDMSGVIVTSAGTGSAKFALAPGHSLPHYGAWDIQPNLLLESQAQVITLAGLYRSWKNAEYSPFTVRFIAPVALIDCFPNQRCTITLTDDVRGMSYSGGIIPYEVALIHDVDNGHAHVEVMFELQTSESLAIQGDVPGSGPTDDPPEPSLPGLPDIPDILPGGLPVPTPNGPTVVVGRESSIGLVLSKDFDQEIPTWITINGGLDVATQAVHISQIVIAPNGSVYVARCHDNDGFIAYAPRLEDPFTIIEDHTSILAKLGGTDSAVCAIACNPLSGIVAYVIASNNGGVYTAKIYTGTGTTFSAGATIPGVGGGLNNASNANLSYGNGKWIFTSSASSATDRQWWRISGDGSTYEDTHDVGDSGTAWHVRAGTTGKTWHFTKADDTIEYGQNNCISVTTIGSLIKVPGGIRWAHNKVAVDPTGQFLLAPWTTTITTGKSSDYGATWVSAGSIPPGDRVYAYAGPGNGGPRWVAAGATVYYTPDNGTTWYNRTGTLGSITGGTPEIELIKVVSW